MALPVFSTDDKSFFHELNHAICSEFVTINNEKIIKCGLDYLDDAKTYINEVINDIISLEIYNIFKSKCFENIFDDNVMEDLLVNGYDNYHHLVNDFYKENKERIKLSVLKHSTFQMTKNELELLNNLIEKNKKSK